MHKIIFAFIILFLLLSGTVFKEVSAIVLDIEMETDKQIYNVGETINISGNVTLDGTPIPNATVAIEVYSPYDQLYVIRTVQTGENVTGYWKVKILDLYACDSQGNPKDIFNKGGFVYINVTIKNIHVLTHHVEVAIYVQCSDNTPLKAFYPTGIDIEGGQEMHWIFSVPIPSNAPSGEAIIFANLYSDQPKTGGTAYCPEKNATFYIQSTTPKAPPQPQHFNITFKLPRKDVKLGNYNIYARSRYITSLASENISFNVILAGDIVKDGIINMRDIGAVCALYGTTEEDPDWNPDADLVKDGIINMRDIGAECNNYGKTAIY